MAAASGAAEQIQTRCCIAGGGPAGMMLGYLLARAGIDVVVLEKHADFLRDFRGDTIHPSTLQVIHELGLLDELLQRPHQEIRELRGLVGDFEVTLADFNYVPTHCRFLVIMPQWDFLNLLAEQARKYPTFQLRMNAEATELLFDSDRVVGLRATTPSGSLEVRAALTVGSDGRHSKVRERAGLVVRDFGAPIDVLWMRLSRRDGDPYVPLGRFDRGRIFVMIYRGDYWQCGYVIAKGGYDEVRSRGLNAFRQEVAELAPFLKDRVDELRNWDQIKLLTVIVDRLEKWYRPGLLCIGDAAHAMSPVGGVGINLAIQDAVAAANQLADPLRTDRLRESTLSKLQHRREWPTRMTQQFQLIAHKLIFHPTPRTRPPRPTPGTVRMFQHCPWLRRIPARLIGVGFRPEHVRTPDVFAACNSID